MCTVKKDITLPESPLALAEDSSATSPKSQPTSADYDLINRQNSQLLLDMIYSSTKKKPCFFSSKLPCPGTPAAAAAIADRTMLDEIAKLKASIADLQSQISKLPAQIVAAMAENANLMKIREDVDDEDFDKLSSVSSEVILPRHSCPSGRTSMSSDIEVLNYCGSRPACSSSSPSSCPTRASTSSLPSIDISKEIAHLAAALNSIVLPKSEASVVGPASYSPEVSSAEAKQIANSLFSHWEQRYLSSKSSAELDRPNSSSGAPIGNIRCHQEAAAESSAIPNIMPYSSAIDMNVWLK